MHRPVMPTDTRCALAHRAGTVVDRRNRAQGMQWRGL